jgi:KUP system potassium uptake protein
MVRRHGRWAVIPAMIGGAAVLSEGIITPPISVTSAIEGLIQIKFFSAISTWTIVSIVLVILFILFFMQQFGTASLGKFFGPVMLVWFLMLSVLGISHIMDDINILKAFNPYYGFNLLTQYPKGFLILGAVFLCTTGAEALYSDLGHAGRGNIRMSWIFVKTSLILNYIGQGAWLLNHKGTLVTDNPFYAIMPDGFRLIGIVIATAATIVASQALISGSFTLISEAMRMNLWSKLKINYPSEEKGQLFIPAVNLLLFIGCCGVVLFFKESKNMEAAYGLTINLGMLMNTTLFSFYLFTHRVSRQWVLFYLLIYLTVELSFLVANLDKFSNGGYVSFVIGGVLFTTMYIWHKARKIKNRYVEFVRLEHYIPKIQELSNDKSVPKYSTHLVYLTSANNPKEIEHKIIYSILNKKPKRADIYWLVHVDTLDDPYTSEYKVEHIIPNDIIRIDIRLGFKVQPRINLMFRKVVEDLVANKEVNIYSRYESLERSNTVGDFQFIVMEKYLSQDNELPFWEKIVMRFYFWIKEISLSEEKGFGLDVSNVTVEKFPLIVAPVTNVKLKRILDED